jgi:hypothetical protein
VTAKETRENAAANAVAAHLTTVAGVAMRVRRWDDGSLPGMHDFFIEGGAQTIALEVTTLADGERVGRDVRWSRETRGGWVEVAGLSGCWLASHEGNAEAVDVVLAIKAHVPMLESLGQESFDNRTWQSHLFAPTSARPPEYDALRALYGAGVRDISRISDASEALLREHGGQVQVIRGFGVSRPLDRNFPVTFIRAQLRDPELHRSDVAKLARVEGETARHLWMWVETTEGLAMIRSFETEGLPDADLAGEGIDGIWLGRGPAPNVVAGHVWLRESGWGEFSSTRDEVLDR